MILTDIVHIIYIITILRIIYVSKVDTRAQSKDLEPVAVMSAVENQMVSGDTTKAPLSMPCGLIMTRSMRWTSIEQFLRKWVTVNLMHPLVLGMTQNQKNVQRTMTRAFCCFSQFQYFEESIILQKNENKTYNAHNSFQTKIKIGSFFSACLIPPWGLEQRSTCRSQPC
jgi:hypothetical protein